MRAFTLSDLALLGQVGGGGGGSDSEVDDWADVRVPGQGGSVSAGTKQAVTTFMLAVKAAGLRDKLKRVGVYAGTPLVALNAPLIIDWGGAFVTDTLAGFLEADYDESTGLGNAATHAGSINTNVNPTTEGVNVNDWHMSIYVRTAVSANQVIMGGQNFNSADIGSLMLVAHVDDTSRISAWSQNAYATAAADASGVGFYVGTRIAADDLQLYKNGSSIVTQASPGGSIPDAAIGVHCYLNANNPEARSNKFVSFYSIGTGLTSAEVSDLYTAVQDLQTALGRAV
jgi:hypothetical protein